MEVGRTMMQQRGMAQGISQMMGMGFANALVPQPHMKEESFLRAAEQRYKGFLHLFRMTNCKVFVFPTYDIDLMWHAHHMNQKAYVEDLTNILGRVLEHNDTDSNRNPGQKLYEGFHQICQHWQQSYDSVEREGAVYSGEPPFRPYNHLHEPWLSPSQSLALH